MERKYAGGGKTERVKGIERRSSKTKAKTNFAMTFSVAEEANTFSAGDNRACSNGRGRKDKYSGSKGTRIGDGSSKKRPLCDGGR